MLDNENRNCNCKCGYMMNNNDNMMVENHDHQNDSDVLSASTSGMSCGNCCGMQGMPPRLPMYSYNFTNIEPEETCPEKELTRSEMLEKIRCLGFAIVELAQYLDTHVDDEKAICLHKEYAKELHDLKDKYQKVYGPLTIAFPCNKWRWIEEPWPWERGNF